MKAKIIKTSEKTTWLRANTIEDRHFPKNLSQKERTITHVPVRVRNVGFK